MVIGANNLPSRKGSVRPQVIHPLSPGSGVSATSQGTLDSWSADVIFAHSRNKSFIDQLWKSLVLGAAMHRRQRKYSLVPKKPFEMEPESRSEIAQQGYSDARTSPKSKDIT